MFPTTYFVSTYYPTTYFPLAGEAIEPELGPQPGGGESKRRWREYILPGDHPNKQRAIYEDEDFIAVIEALIAKRRN